MLRGRKFITVVWMGLGLASLFFYPLFSVLLKNSYLLHWRRINTVELIVAYVIFALIATCLLVLVERIRNNGLRLLMLFLVIFPSSFLFAGQMVRHLGIGEQLIALTGFIARHLFFAAVNTLIVASLVIWWAWKQSHLLYRIVWKIILVISIINVVAFQILWSTRGMNSLTSIARHSSAQADTRVHLPDIYIFLFDELSHDLMYDNKTVRANLPNFQALSSVSDNYHGAISPGESTIPAIPSLLIIDHNFISGSVKGKRVVLDSGTGALPQTFRDYAAQGRTLFWLAKQHGYATAIVGPYLKYCRTFEKDIDACQIFSMFNFMTMTQRWSILNPILTSFALLPHQYPSGLLKIPTISRIQRSIIERTDHFVQTTIAKGPHPQFLFAHVYLPHLPFVFTREGYHWRWDAFEQNEENYVRQLEYTDTLLGRWIQTLKEAGKFDSSIIVVLSDHNYRKMFPGTETHVPLIVKGIGQKAAKNIDTQVQTEQILYALFGQ